MQAEIDEICVSVMAEQRKCLQLEDLLALRLRLVQVDQDLHSTEHYVRVMLSSVVHNQYPHQKQTLLDEEVFVPLVARIK